MLKKISICLLLLITIYTRFVNLNWDRGFGLHPDENNLWGASRHVKLLTQLDPNFYAYAGFPIYVYSLLEQKVQARAISAAVQTFIVLLLFFLGKKFAGWSGGISSAVMGTFSAGLAQAAHFLTVESLLGLFGLLIVFCFLEVYETSSKVCKLPLVAAAIAFGLGVGTKTSFVVFVLPFLVVLRPGLWRSKTGVFARFTRQSLLQKALPFMMLVLTLSLAFLVFLLVNPYVFDRWESIRGTLTYEASVATGKFPIFYTRQFIDTSPGWFQVVHIFPFITGWLFIPLFLVGFFTVCVKVGPRRTSRSDLIILLLACLSALFSFLPLFAKWTRYVVQVLPVLILIAGIGASWLWKRGLFGRLFVAAALMTFLPPFFSMLSVYQHQDTRLAAARWAASHIDGQAKIFTEAMDLGIIPFNPSHGTQVTLFNFYGLDSSSEASAEEDDLERLVDESDYVISVSERVYGNSLRRPDLFPRSASFYKSLFDGSLGYEKIYDSFDESDFFSQKKSLARQNPALATPRLASLTILAESRRELRSHVAQAALADGARSGCVDTDHKSGELRTGVCLFSPEETFSVFDHPRVMIFAKESMK